MNTKQTGFWTVVTAAMVLGATQSQAESPAETLQRPPFAHEISDLPSDPRVVYGELENGLRYAVMYNDTPEGTASMRLRIAAGSFSEKPDERGIAHYLEHMAFNGSENIPEGEMIHRLERSGLSFGADTNAHTSFDETVYKLNLPNVEVEVLDEAFMLMRETADKLTLAADAIDRERGIIRSEKRARNTPGFQKLIAQMEFFGAGSGLVESLPIGTDETIDSINSEQMRAFYESHYHPEKAFFVFAGDLEPEKAIARIRETFSDWRPDTAPAPIATANLASGEPGRVGYHYDSKGMTDATLAVMLPYESQPDTSARRKERLLANLGNGVMWYRFRRLVDAPDALILRGSAFSGSYQDVANFAAFQIGSQPEDWAVAIAVGEQELRRALEFGFDETEFDMEVAEHRASLQTRAAQADTVSTHGRFGGLTDKIIKAYDGERVFMHAKDELEWFETVIQDVDVEDVNTVFRAQWNNGEGLSAFVASSVPIEDPETDIMAAVEKSRSQDVLQRPAEEPIQFALELPNPPGKIVDESHDDVLGARFVKFDNNVRLNIKQTDFKSNEVMIAVQVGDGALSLPEKDEGLRRLALNLLSGGGLKDHTELELRKHFGPTGIYWRTYFAVDSDAILLSGRAKPDTFDDLLEVLTAFTIEPGLRRDAGERYKNKIRAWYDTHDATASGVASKEIPRLIRSGDKRFGFDDLDNFLDAPYEQAADWLRTQLTTGLIEITVIGDIDPDTVVAQIAATFGALDERADIRGEYPEMTRISFPIEYENTVSFWHEGEADQSLLRMYWPAPDGSDPQVARQMRVLSTIFKNQLVTEIREDSAATYSPGVGMHGDQQSPDYGYVMASLGLLPDTIPDTMQRIDQVAGELGKGKISKDEFDRALLPIAEDMNATVQTNGYWLKVLSDAQTDGRGIASHRGAKAAYDEMTLEEVALLAESVFGPDYRLAVQILPTSMREEAAESD